MLKGTCLPRGNCEIPLSDLNVTQEIENILELNCHSTTKECWGSPQEYNTFVRFGNSYFVLKIESNAGEFDEFDYKALRKRLEPKVGRNIRLRLVFLPYTS